MTRDAYNNSITAFNPPALFLPTRNIALSVVCNDWRFFDVGDQRNYASRGKRDLAGRRTRRRYDFLPAPLVTAPYNWTGAAGRTSFYLLFLLFAAGQAKKKKRNETNCRVAVGTDKEVLGFLADATVEMRKGGKVRWEAKVQGGGEG